MAFTLISFRFGVWWSNGFVYKSIYYSNNNNIPSQSTTSNPSTKTANNTTNCGNNKNDASDNGISTASSNNIGNNIIGLSEAQLRQMRLTVVEQRKKAILERFVCCVDSKTVGHAKLN